MHRNDNTRPERQRRRIEIIDSPTERTTAATDAILAVLALAGCLGLQRARHTNPWKANLWTAAFGALSLGAAVGTIAHGFKMSPTTNQRIWRPLNLALSTALALFTTGVIYDTWGQRAAQRALPATLASAGAFFIYTLLRPGSYLIFVLYQSIGMLFALGAYGRLALQQRMRGARLITAGVLTTIIAGAIQASERISFTLIWKFDHNGVYHLTQMAGILLLYRGLRAALQEDTHTRRRTDA